METQEVKDNGGMVEVPEDITTLIAGLRRLGETEGVGSHLDRVKRLSIVMDQQAESDDMDSVALLLISLTGNGFFWKKSWTLLSLKTI